MTWSYKAFGDLDLQTLYDILQLRQEVFIVEQDCPYLDADGKDQLGIHLMCYDGRKLVAYTRLLPKGVSYEDYCSIGRVLNSMSVRGTGMGKELMERSISICGEYFPGEKIKISAQVYLEIFYTRLGFVETGDRYDEDGIPHMAMTYQS